MWGGSWSAKDQRFKDNPALKKALDYESIYGADSQLNSCFLIDFYDYLCMFPHSTFLRLRPSTDSLIEASNRHFQAAVKKETKIEQIKLLLEQKHEFEVRKRLEKHSKSNSQIEVVERCLLAQLEETRLLAGVQGATLEQAWMSLAFGKEHA